MRRARWMGPGPIPAALLGSSLLLAGACTPYATASSERLRTAATEELCAQRDAPVGGARIRRELRLRGADCSAFEAALAGEPRFDLARPFVPSAPPPDQARTSPGMMAFTPPGSLPPPVPLGRGLPPAGSASSVPPTPQFGWTSPPPGSAWPPDAARFGSPPPDWFTGPEAGAQAYGDRAAPAWGWSGGAVAALPSAPAWSGPLPRGEPPPWARDGWAPSPRGLAPPEDAAEAPDHYAALTPSPSIGAGGGRAEAAPAAVGRGALAPLIAPGCAERLVEPPHGPGQRGTVTFRNDCGVPVRVRFAARPGVALTEVTPLLRPGETSAPVTLADGFEHPGYIVCSYERVSERALCQ